MIQALGSTAMVLVLLLVVHGQVAGSGALLRGLLDRALQARLDERAEGRPAAPLGLPGGTAPLPSLPAGPARSPEGSPWRLVLRHVGQTGPLAVPLEAARLAVGLRGAPAPDGAGPSTPDPPNNNRVILVGGFNSPSDVPDLRAAALALGYPAEDIVAFSYRDFRCDRLTGRFVRSTYQPADTRREDLRWQAERLRSAVRLCHELTGRHADVIGHSQGGVVALGALLLDPDPCHAGFDHLVTIDAPLQGLPELSAHAPTLEMAGHGNLAQMGSESELMESYRAAAAGGGLGCGVSLTTLSAVNDAVVSSSYSYFPSSLAEEPELVQNQRLLVGPRLALSGRLDPLFHGGAVQCPRCLEIMRRALSDEPLPRSPLLALAWHGSNQLLDLLPGPGRPGISLLRLGAVGLLASLFAWRQLGRSIGAGRAGQERPVGLRRRPDGG